MFKYTPLLFCLVFAKTGHAQAYTSAETITGANDTLVAPFRLDNTITGDTAYFGMEGERHDELERYFRKRLQVPESGGKPIAGIARVYFILDKTGRVTQAWYDPSGNSDIGLSVLQIVNQLPVIRPSSIKGEPVITKVVLKVLVKQNEEQDNGQFAPDITEVAPRTVH